jgi:hypothetical protein
MKDIKHDDIIASLAEMKSWNSFATSLVSQYTIKGDLSVNQWEAAERMILKLRHNKKRSDENANPVDVSRINALLNKALSSKLKYPKFRIDGLCFSLAPLNSQNAGAVYVKHDGEYIGKIQNGKYTPTLRALELNNIGAKIARVAANPREAAVEYGKMSGQCACCGRTLTDPASVDAGIGPICAANWGL